MTQNPDTFQNLTEAEIEEIIVKVDASKPWSGYLRSIEMFLAKFHTRTIFTAHGIHLVMGYLIINYRTDFSLQSFLINWKYFLFVPFFTLIDIYFAFFPSKFDKMSIRDWCLLILKEYDFNQSKTQDIFKYSLYFYIPFSIFVHFFYQNIYASLLTYSLYSIFLTALYLGTDTILFFKYKKFWTMVSQNVNPSVGGNKIPIFVANMFVLAFLLSGIEVIFLEHFFQKGFVSYHIYLGYIMYFIFNVFTHFWIYAHYRGLKLYYIASALSYLSKDDKRLRNLFYYN